MDNLSDYKGNMTEKLFQKHLDLFFSLYTLNKEVNDRNSYWEDFFFIVQKYYREVFRYTTVLQECANSKLSISSIRRKLMLDSQTIDLMLREDVCQTEVYNRISDHIWGVIRPALFEMLEEVDQKYRSKTAELARKLFD